MGVFKVLRQIVLDQMDVDSILFELAVPEIFHFKHDAGASNVQIFIGNSDVDSIRVVSDDIPVLT